MCMNWHCIFWSKVWQIQFWGCSDKLGMRSSFPTASVIGAASSEQLSTEQLSFGAAFFGAALTQAKIQKLEQLSLEQLPFGAASLRSSFLRSSLLRSGSKLKRTDKRVWSLSQRKKQPWILETAQQGSIPGRSWRGDQQILKSKVQAWKGRSCEVASHKLFYHQELMFGVLQKYFSSY